jgi:hypothetical protein
MELVLIITILQAKKTFERALKLESEFGEFFTAVVQVKINPLMPVAYKRRWPRESFKNSLLAVSAGPYCLGNLCFVKWR